MYKVFFNQKPLILTTSFVEQTQENPVFFLKFTTKKNIILALKAKQVKQLYLYHPKEDKLWELFLQLFKTIEAAGGIVKNKHTNKYLFIYRNNKWDLPKGKIEENESVKDAAIREVEEETGVKRITIDKPLLTTFHIFNRRSKYRLKKTYWYAMHTDYNGETVPQIEEGIQKAIWKSAEEVPELFGNAYANIKLLWEASNL
jgi:8-oxo-dGTP pyrophosphatase MutT (NUDIX family)